MARYSGGCACGAVRYELDGEPLAQNHCQCLDCRRRSGTGHGSYVALQRNDGAHFTGETRAWSVAGDSGNAKAYHFCPTCGVPLWVTFSAAPGIYALQVGSLDEPARFVPGFVSYGLRALPWDAVDPKLKVFERMPPM